MTNHEALSLTALHVSVAEAARKAIERELDVTARLWWDAKSPEEKAVITAETARIVFAEAAERARGPGRKAVVVVDGYEVLELGRTGT